MIKSKPQMYNDGVAVICRIENSAPPGGMPMDRLVEKARLRYRKRTVGVNRYYAALQDQIRVDYLLRCPYRGNVVSNDIVLLGAEQYAVRQVQCPEDITPPVMDLTLERVEQSYELAADS